MKFKKLESGRSMVEMLGVLAIIGVLSVGGIAGYSLSMRRHRANQIVDYISKFALTEYAKCQVESEYSMVDCRMNSYLADSDEKYQPSIGRLPAGLDYLWVNDFSVGSDSVNISLYMYFSDQKLCQAVASILGAACDTHAITPLIRVD